MQKKDLSLIAKRRTKLIYEAFQEEPDDREMLFQAAAMCQVYFPRREPDLQPHEPWEQRSGKSILYITPQPFPDPVTGEKTYSGLPYGPKARVLLANLNTIAIQKQSRTIQIANNPAKFLKDIGLTDGGNQLSVIQDQMHRLSNCVLRTFYLDEQEQTGETVPIVTRTKRNQWASQITLSEEYYTQFRLQKRTLPPCRTTLRLSIYTVFWPTACTASRTTSRNFSHGKH